ncbi:MAG: hypothetical protein ABIG11_09530, partial [bacterium]
MCTIILVFFEGLCNIAFVLKSLHRPLAERVHTRYDELLGWVNIPNIFLKNMYGDGVYLRTNSRGFRSNVDFAASVPEGKTRIICSGDSFTLGYGVDNDHTWCRLLAFIDTRLETVNMGQGGYGIDQAYLWYMRDGIKLDHQIHMFAVIGGDFYRSGDSFLGYGKPYFKMQNNSLVLCNVPVPKRPFHVPWLTENIEGIKSFRTVWMLRGIYNKLLPAQKKSRVSNQSNADERAIALKIFSNLAGTNKLKQSMLIIVYLPIMADLENCGNSSSDLRNFLNSELPKRGLLYMDLVDDFKNLSKEELGKMFIDDLKYPFSKGHYSVKGNQY